MIINFNQAAELLKKQKIVAVPTETVYGLAAKYDSDLAIEAIYFAKKRPKNHPLIIHINDKHWAYQLAQDIPPYAYKLMDFFWPGPLTLIFHKKSSVSNLITAHQSTVAIRLPGHNLLLKLIEKVGVPLVAPSANLFCKTSPTNALHVEANFNQKIPVLDGGECELGIESTIISCVEKNKITMLRPGIIGKNQIEKISQVPVTNPDPNHKIQSPGSNKLHYQPIKKIIYFDEIKFMRDFIRQNQKKCFLISINPIDCKENYKLMPANPKAYSKIMYQTWQSISEKYIDFILVEMPPDTDEWQGIRNRIQKAGLPINHFINKEDFL